MATKTAKTPETLLAAANGRRHVRTLDVTDIEVLVSKGRAGEDGYWAWQNGGLAHHSYECLTTIAVVAKIDGKVYLGITSGNGRTQGTPAAAWPEWRNLGRSNDDKQAEKLAAWVQAKHRNVIEM